MPANFSATAKSAKNSDDFSFGIRLANSERLSAWVPPRNIDTSTARRKNSAAVDILNPRKLITQKMVSET
jgi:hypothetical protein